jgi:RNA polymerase sigma-70 factor (ECF subfamily)
MAIQASSPHAQFELKEHITFCLTCVSKSLPLEQQLCVFLKEIYDFKVIEIAEILSSTEAMIKYYLHTGRSKLITVFEGRCALINKEGTCHQCSELNGIFNPKQNFEVEKNKIELARTEEKGDKEHLLDLRLKLMNELDPFLSAGSDLQIHHLEHNRKVMENYSE